MGAVFRKKAWGQSVLTTGTLTATTTSAIDTGYAGVDNVILQLAVTAASGTTPTLDVVVYDSIDGTNWNIIATFAQKTTTGQQEVKRVTGPFGNAFKVVSTIGAVATPSFTFSVTAQVER